MARPDKAAAVAELTTAFRDSTAAVLTEYRGLTVAELKELRRSLGGNATYIVVKNTLTRIAAKEAGVEAFDGLLEGPSAIAFISGDPVEVAKGLRNFGKEHSKLVVKGGLLDGKALSADDIRKLADLESREVLLAKLAGGFIAPAQQFASVLAAPVRQLAQLLGALQAKAAADPTWAKGGDGASVADPQPAAADAPAETEALAEGSTPADVVADAPAEAIEIAEAAADAGAPAEIAADEAAPVADEAPTDTSDSTEETDGVADASTDS